MQVHGATDKHAGRTRFLNYNWPVHYWHLIPRFTIQDAATCLWRTTAYLLEEERDFGRGALIANLPHPAQIELSKSDAALSPDDHPVDSLQIERQWTEKRLTGKKSCGSWKISQLGDTVDYRLTFH